MPCFVPDLSSDLAAILFSALMTQPSLHDMMCS